MLVDDSPITVSTAHRLDNRRSSRSRSWKEAGRYTLFPVGVRPSIVMTYSVYKNGARLSRESQDIVAPGDYGLYTIVNRKREVSIDIDDIIHTNIFYFSDKFAISDFFPTRSPH